MVSICSFCKDWYIFEQTFEKWLWATLQLVVDGDMGHCALTSGAEYWWIVFKSLNANHVIMKYTI